MWHYGSAGTRADSHLTKRPISMITKSCEGVIVPGFQGVSLLPSQCRCELVSNAIKESERDEEKRDKAQLSELHRMAIDQNDED
jgi:hypothetical protein